MASTPAGEIQRYESAGRVAVLLLASATLFVMFTALLVWPSTWAGLAPFINNISAASLAICSSIWDGLSQFAVNVGTKGKATDTIRAALVSMAGSIFGATAIGISLSVFFIGQNIQRLHYATFQRVYRPARIIRFVLTTIALALTDYLLATIITAENSYVICMAAALVVASFTFTILRFFISNMNLLDPKATIDTTFVNCDNYTKQRVTEFEKFLGQLTTEVAGKETEDVLKVARENQDKIVVFAEKIVARADKLIEELVPIVVAHARQGDYGSVECACDVIADTCINSIARMDHIFVSCREKMVLKFTNRVDFGPTFWRTFKIAREAAKNTDVHLDRLLVSMYTRVAQSIAPNSHFSVANQSNAYTVIHLIKETAALPWDDRSEASIICLNAYKGLIKNWNTEFPIFPHFLKNVIPKIAVDAFPGRSGNYVVERSFTCFVVLMQRALILPAEVSQVKMIFKAMSDLIAKLVEMLPAYDPQPDINGILDVLVSTKGGLHHETLFRIVETECQEYVYPIIANMERVRSLPRLVAFIDEYLLFLQSTGELVVSSAFADNHTSKIVETMLKCLALCTELRNTLISDKTDPSLVNALVQKKLDALPDEVQKLSRKHIDFFYLSFNLPDIALPHNGPQDDDVTVAVVKVCLRFADFTPGIDSGNYFYMAATLAALDQSGRSIGAISDAVQSGGWINYAAAFPAEASQICTLLALPDEPAFLNDDSSFSMVLPQKRAILDRIGFPKLRSTQDEVLRILRPLPNNQSTAPLDPII